LPEALRLQIGLCSRWLYVKWATGFDLGPAIAQKLDRMAAFQYDECVLSTHKRHPNFSKAGIAVAIQSYCRI